MVAIALTAAFAGDGSTTGLEAAFATFISNVATAIDTGAWPS